MVHASGFVDKPCSNRLFEPPATYAKRWSGGFLRTGHTCISVMKPWHTAVSHMMQAIPAVPAVLSISAQLCIQQSESFSFNVDGAGNISIMVYSAFRTIPLSYRKILYSRIDSSTYRTHLWGWKELIHKLYRSSIPVCLVFKHPDKPSCYRCFFIRYWLSLILAKAGYLSFFIPRIGNHFIGHTYRIHRWDTASTL